jgi:selenide,water dikinase
MPVNVLPVETIRKILEGGQSVCAKAGIPVAGGHSIDSVEPIYGLVAIGLADPRRIKRNADAKPGDAIILGKGLGVGIYSAAIKKEKLNATGYEAMIASTTQLNTPGLRLAELDGVHALTDVTGFGLAGHLLEICKGSKVSANLAWNKVPLLPGVVDLVESGFKTGASTRNWASYGELVDLGQHGEKVKTLLSDPQTSGGLLVTCAQSAVPAVLKIFRSEGFERVTVIGEVVSGEPGIRVA